jgi:hypothetical protein
MDKGDITTARKLATDAKKIIADSFLTEKQKTAQWQLSMNKWLKGLSVVGMGLLGLITNTLASLITLFRSIIPLTQNMLSGNWDENKKILKRVDELANEYSRSGKQIVSGFKMLGNAFKESGSQQMTGPLENIMRAFTYNPWSDEADPSYRPEPRAFPQDQEGPSVRLGGAFGPNLMRGLVGGLDDTPKDPGIRMDVGAAKKPIQGGMSIMFEAPDELGNIHAHIEGNCPDCGVKFGKVEKTSLYEAPSAERVALPKTQEDDVEVLATMLASEGGFKKLETEKGRKELAGIAFTAINRARRRDASLRRVITGGHGFGKQGAKRAYSTAAAHQDPKVRKGRKVTDPMRQYAADILSGKVANPVGQATFFLHNTFGKGYGKKSDPVALPKFATTARNVNVANINRARFYAPTNSGEMDAPERARLDAKYIENFEKRNSGTEEESLEPRGMS